MKLSIIIPVYNEEQTIGEVVERVCAVDIGAIEKEIIIANDGSATARGGDRRAADGSTIRGCKIYDSPINVGKGAAVRHRAERIATGDIMLIQDADLELDPAEYSGCWRRFSTAAPRSSTARGFSSRRRRICAADALANRVLTMLTNVLFGGRLTDMETALQGVPPRGRSRASGCAASASISSRS